jgi:hypothetical protein
MLKSVSPLGLRRLRKTVYFAPVLLLLAVVSLSGVPFAHAQSLGGWTSAGWVSSASIQDLTGNSNLTPNQPLLAGHSYNATLQIKVPFSSASAGKYQVSLNSRLQSATGQSVFWLVRNPDYPGYNRTAFIAGSSTVIFNYVQGTLSLSAYFLIPANFTNPSATYGTPSGNVTRQLHLPQNNVTLVSVVPIGSGSAGWFSATVIDQTIQEFQTNYNQTSNYVPSGKIPSAYTSIVTPILSEAQALYNLGFPDQGTTLLKALVPSGFPTPPDSSLQTYLLVGLGVAVVLVVLLAVMMMRSKGRSGYSTSLIGEVQKDLAVLEVTAAKYDRAMADKLKSLRAKLSDTS